MHIVLIPHQFYPDSYGGVETVTYRLANHLVAQGHRINILCHHFSSDETGDIRVIDEIYENLPVRRLSYNPKYCSVEAGWTLRDEDIAHQVEATFGEWEPDIVHPLGVSLITTASIVASRKRGIPVICSITNYESMCRRGNLVKGNGSLCCGQQSFRKCWECTHPSSVWNDLGYRLLHRLPRIVVVTLAEINRHSLRPLATLETARLVDLRLNQLLPLLHKVDVYVVISNWMRKVLLLNGMSEEQIFVSPRGVASSLVAYAKTKTDHLRFGYLGRINYDKGVHIAIRAFQALQHPQESTLTIFGKPTNLEEQAYAQTLHNLARDEPGIYFAGYIRADGVAQTLKDIDVLLVPSIWHEPFGQVNIEAIATRTPVIASNIGGIPEIIKDGVNGLLFPPGDIRALSRKMQRFIDEPALKTEIASNARSWRSFEEEARFFIELYEQLQGCTRVEQALNNV